MIDIHRLDPRFETIHASGSSAGAAFPVRVQRSGTSISAPHVSGICDQLPQAFPTMRSAQIGAALVASSFASTASTIFDPQLGFGQIDAKKADTTPR